MYTDSEFLPLSGVQHYAFCPRQWGLICLEQEWAENVLTAQGDLFHSRAHDASVRERRGDTLTVRGLGVKSSELGLSGICDVAEFHRASKGHPLFGVDGLWQAVPVEYKRGKSKSHDADRLQLCAQAMCLEEMLVCNIEEGFLYYGKTRSRERVAITARYRDKVREISQAMHEMAERQHVPRGRKRSSCASCSLCDICLPKVSTTHSVSEYISARLGEGGAL